MCQKQAQPVGNFRGTSDGWWIFQYLASCWTGRGRPFWHWIAWLMDLTQNLVKDLDSSQQCQDNPNSPRTPATSWQFMGKCVVHDPSLQDLAETQERNEWRRKLSDNLPFSPCLNHNGLLSFINHWRASSIARRAVSSSCRRGSTRRS